MRAFYEELWERLPAELAPPELARRRAFQGSLPAGPMLDLGCGDGVLTPEGAVGADIAEAALARARRRRPDGTWVRVPEEGPLPFADGAFAVLWCSETLEHVADTAAFLAEARRVLAPGGALGVTVPRFRARHGLRPARHLHPLGDHLRFYVARTLADVLDDAGFAEVEIRRGGPLLLAAARRT
jgi:SAM-dependent methyltransferase